MKKRIMILLLAGMLLMSGSVSGCNSKNSEKADKYKELGISQMDAGDYEKAVTSFEKALDQSNGWVTDAEIDLCYYKALAQDKAGDTEDAIATYSGLIDYDENNWKAYYLRGCVYLQTGQGKACLSDYNKAIEQNGSDFELYGNIYQNLSDAGYEEQGLKYLDQALQLKDTKANAYGLGYIYYLKEDYDNALTYLKKACDAGTDKAWLLLGEIYAKQGDVESAQSAFNTYLEKYPDDAGAIEDLGDAAMASGDYSSAITYYEKVKDSGDSDVLQSAWRNLVAAYEKNEQYDMAYETAEGYVTEYPDDEEMQKEAEFLETRVGDGAVTEDSGDSDASEESGTDSEDTGEIQGTVEESAN